MGSLPLQGRGRLERQMLEDPTQTIQVQTEAATPGVPDLEDPALYFNRELSWLDFNERVLELAEDPSVPLLERVMFCSIYSSNLD
jgi:polyphosphate kinase